MNIALKIIKGIAFFFMVFSIGGIVCSGFEISSTILLVLAIFLIVCISIKQKEDKEDKENVTEKGFFDIEVGDKVVVYDEYSHDYVEHVIKINAIEYDRAMRCYGTDLTWWDEELQEYVDDNYITIVTEGNFVRFYKEEE